MNTYCFYTKDNFRQDVKGSTPESAFRHILAMPGFRERFTGAYGIYDKDGLIATGTIHGRINNHYLTK
jgi:hypothetical protein